MKELDRAGGATPSKFARVQRWTQEGQKIRWSINDRVDLAVEDEMSRRMLLDLVDRLEMLEDIRLASKQLDGGKGLSLEQVKERARQKYGISI